MRLFLVDETESVASDASLRSVRDRIAIFEALQESGHAHPYQPHPKPRLSIDSSASGKFSQPHEETMAEEFQPKTDEKPVSVIPPEVSPSAVTETKTVIQETEAGTHGSSPSVQSGIAEAEDVNIAYALRESGDVSAVPANQAWHTAGKQSTTGFEEHTDEPLATPQSEEEIKEKTQSGVGKMALAAGAAVVGTVTAGFIASEMESPGVPESEPVLHADIREVGKTGESITQHTQRDDKDVYDEDIYESKSHTTEEHNFPQNYEPEGSVQEEECLISEKSPAEEKEYFRHDDALSEDGQYLHEQVTNKFEDEILPQHLEHDQSQVQEKNYLKEFTEEVHPEMVTDSHDVLTGGEVRLGQQEPVPEAVFAPADEDTEVKKHSESVISMMPGEGHWSRTVVEVAEQPAVNVYTAPLTEEGKQQERQTYSEDEIPESAAGEERYTKEIEQEWSPKEIEQSEETLAQKEIESSQNEPRLAEEEEHVGVDDTSGQKDLPKEYQTHENIEYQGFADDEDNTQYETERPIPLKIEEPIKQKHIEESILAHKRKQEPHITSEYGSPVQEDEQVQFEKSEPIYGDEDKESINISYEEHGVSHVPESKPKSPHFDDYEQDDYGPESIKQQSEDKSFIQHEHVEHQIGEQESVPEAILVESHEHERQQRELEMPEEIEARDESPTQFATEHDQPEIFLRESKDVLNEPSERKLKMSEEPFKQVENQPSAEVPSTVTRSPSSAMSFESQATVISAGKNHTYDEDVSVANNEEEGVITPVSTPEATPGTVDRTRSLYEQEHYGDGMAVHTEICPPEHLQDEYKESEEETIVQPPGNDETFEIQSQKSIEETSEGREASQFENKSDQKSPIDESYMAQAFVKTEDDTEANIGDKDTYGDEIATPESPKMPSSQVVVSYDLVEDQKSDEEHEMPHSEEIALASEERPQEVEIIIEAPEETTEEQWLVEKEEIIPQSEAVGQIEQEAQRAPSPEEIELHTKSEKYEWDGQEAEKIPQTEELIVDSTDVNYGNRNEYVTDRGEIPDYAYEEEPHQEAQAMEEDDDIMVESEEVAVPVQHDFPSELPDHARHEPFEKESHDDVSEESSGPEKVGEASQIEEFEPEHFGKHHEESIVDSAQVSAKRSDSFDLPKASSAAIPDQQEIESPIRESTYGEDEIKSDIEYSVDEGVIESENVPLHEEQAGSPLISDIRRSSEAEFISEERCEKPHDEEFEEKSKEEAQAMEEEEDIMVESEEVAVPVQHDFPSELPDHARHESFEKEPEDDVLEESSRKPEEANESPTMFSPTVTAYGDKDNIFDISRSPTFEKESHDDVSEESSGPEKVGEASQIEEFEPEHFGKHHEESIVDSAQISAKVANNEEEGVITPASTPEATPGTVDRTRSLYEQEHYGDGMAVHTEICPPEHLQDEYKESEEETIVQPPETEETFEIQSQKSIEETSEGRETSQFENKSDQKSPIDESYTAQAFVKTEDDTEANIGDKESYGDEIATQESPKMPSSQVVLSYDLVEDQKSDEEHEMPHSEEIALASEERPQEVEIIIEAPEETTEEQWLVEKEEIIPQSEAVGQIEQEAQRAPSPEENELHTKSEKYEWDGQEAKKIPETEELIVDSTDVNYGKTNEYVTDRGEIPDYAYEEEPHQEAQAMEEDDDIMVESEEVAVPVQHDFPSELPDHARHESFEKEPEDDVLEESSGPEKVGEASQIEEFEPEHFGKHHEESIVDSAQVSAKRSDSFDLPKASSAAIPDQQEIESPIRESTYGEDEIKSDIEYSVDEGVIESENVPLHEEQAGSPLISDIRRSSEAEFISEERCEKPHDEEFEEKSKEEAQAMEEDEDIMVESEEVAVPVQHDFPSELPDHARHESFEKEPEDDVLEESSRKPEEANESPTMFSPTVTAYGDKDNIFDISRSPTPPPYKETDLMTQSVYGKIHDENPVEAEMHPSEDIMTQSMYKEQVHEVDRPLSEQEDEELVSNYELIEAAELQKESPLDSTDIENRIKSTSPSPRTQDDKIQRTPEAESKEYESEFYVVDEKDLETMDKEGFQRLQSEEIIEAQAVDLVDDVLQNIAYEAQEEKALGRERSIDEEVADAEIRRVSATQLTPADGSLSPATSLGLPGAGDLFSRPKSPVPPRAAEAVVTSGSPQEEQAKTGPGSTESLPGNVDSAGSSPSISSLQRRKDQQLAIAADNLSEGSLQEFERLEQEIQLRRGSGASGGSPNGGIPAAEEKLILIQSAGSLNSLQEFENLEKEVGVHETTQAQPPEGIGAEDVMMLSDIREESDEAEEMSTREDDEDEESSADIVPSLPHIADQEVPKDDYQHQLDASAYAQEAMLCSIDSLEAGRQPHAGTEYDHHLMETSVDSLEAGIIHGSELVQHEREKSDSVIDNISQDSRNQPHSQETGMSADTDTTFQEYQEDEGDKDSLDGVVQSYPTTLTTFETIQTKDDGTTETITRKVLTRVTDPVHSRVRFTGTDSEDQLRNISTEPIESVDEEGNITTIRRQTIH
ncbi:hypothetical protein Ddc_06161 [Ditylenchus destructor]|nr:hypothetical protein Ddc_06161 [Ditylenchus destructor]